MIHILTQSQIKSPELADLISLCRSNSGISGKRLRKAHERLGNLIAPSLVNTTQHQRFTVLIMMRAGQPFGQGIADELEQMGYETAVLFVGDNVIREQDYPSLDNRELIIADSVVNSGKSVCKVIDQLRLYDCTAHYQIATTVMPESAVNESRFTNTDIHTVRLSKNRYEGAKVNNVANGKGPDTGDRLFCTFS